MAFNLVDSVKGVFSGNIVSKASSLLGESESSIQKALSVLLPSTLVGLLHRSSTPDGAATVMSLSSEANKGGFLGNVTNLIGGGSLLTRGMNMVKGLFGDKQENIVSMTSNYAGIKESSAASLMSMAVPATLGTVGKYAEENHLDSKGVVTMLDNQKNSILNSVPSGINLAGALGVGSLSEIGNRLSSFVSSTWHSSVRMAGEVAQSAKSGTRWALPLIILALIILGIWWFASKGCGTASNKLATTTDTMSAMTQPQPTTTVKESMMVTLPNGQQLTAYKGGIEDKLVAFLKTDYKSLGTDKLKNTWFDFDNLNFETGNAIITPESQAQVDNIAAILKAFPNANIKIGGYTDKTGDESANMKLSQDRADAVKAALDKAGVGKQVIGAEGYGSKFAKMPADASENDRQADRHVSVSVR